MICYYSKLLNMKEVCNKNPEWVRIKKGKHALMYAQYHMGFDIETTNVVSENEKLAFMYHWQFGINQHTIMGRTWDEFTEFLARLQKQLKLTEHRRVIIWIANEGFEFQFMRRRLNITEVFARTKREPLLAVHNKCIEFRDALPISGGDLAFLAKNYTNVRKKKGDLDFSIPRNSHTPLTEKEQEYCIYDVRALVEWSKYIFERFIIKENYIPMTKTGILRHIIKSRVSKDVLDFVHKAFPSQSLYNIMMKWLFRGGFTHANMWWVNMQISGVNGYDLTSSYPAVMHQYDKFPMSKLKRLPYIRTEEDLKKIPKNCPYFIAVRFTDIESTTYHSIESTFKCVRLEGETHNEKGIITGKPLIDNGRVSKAAIMSVFLTDIDFSIYKLFYKWRKMEIYACYYAAGGRLPKYLREPLAEIYLTKAFLKKSGQEDTIEYVEAKKSNNSGYGMTVTKIYLDDIEYVQGRENDIGDLEEWIETPVDKPWYRIVKSQFLLPQWGIWITSEARARLLRTVYAIEQESEEGGDVVYCDTDSIYMVNCEKHQHIIDDYNNNIYAVNRVIFGDIPEYRDLGEFDKINKKSPAYWNFKTLGAKRYIKTQKLIVNNRVYMRGGETTVTVAGLPKKSLQNYCKKNKLNIYDVFRDGMTMDVLFSQKNAHKYNDKPTSAIVDGEEMHELSSVCIYPTTFSLSWADIYKSLLEELAERKREVMRYV